MSHSLTSQLQLSAAEAQQSCGVESSLPTDGVSVHDCTCEESGSLCFRVPIKSIEPLVQRESVECCVATDSETPLDVDAVSGTVDSGSHKATLGSSITQLSASLDGTKLVLRDSSQRPSLENSVYSSTLGEPGRLQAFESNGQRYGDTLTLEKESESSGLLSAETAYEDTTAGNVSDPRCFRFSSYSSTPEKHKDVAEKLDASPSSASQYHSESTQHIFVFYNPMSGCQMASVLANPELQRANLYFGHRHVRVRLWDIRQGGPCEKPGFIRLKHFLEHQFQPLSNDATPLDTAGQKNASPPLVRVIVAGGDGTVMWCVSELRAHGIDLTKIAIGVIPFGTGNDFARVLAWSAAFSGNNANPRKILRHLARQWMEADIVLHDLWNVEVQVHETGVFKHVNPITRSKQVMTEKDEEGQPVPVKAASFKMCNYFSIGVESRIGVSFDRYRTSSQFWNKIRYAAEGLKKSFFKHTLKVNEIVSHMSCVDPETNTFHTIFRCPCPDFILEKTHSDCGYTISPSLYSRSSQGSSDSFASEAAELTTAPLFTDPDPNVSRCSLDVNATTQVPQSLCNTSVPPLTMDSPDSTSRRSYHPYSFSGQISLDHCPSRAQHSLNGTNLVSKEHYFCPTNAPFLIPAASLIAINIPSFAAGLDIWKSAQRVGLAVMPDGSGVYPLMSSLSRPQRLGDGVLEFVTFSSAASMGFERMSAFHGRGKKVAQGRGPFYLHFHDLPRHCRVYFQVDGEFYLMNCPRQVSLNHDCTIRVLASPQSLYRSNYVLPSDQPS